MIVASHIMLTIVYTSIQHTHTRTHPCPRPHILKCTADGFCGCASTFGVWHLSFVSIDVLPIHLMSYIIKILN